MAIFDLFSKRQKVLHGEVPNIYTYDSLPNQLKIQIIYIISDAIGMSLGYRYPDDDIYKFINDTLCREYGKFQLNSGHTDSHKEAVFLHFKNNTDIEQSIDFIELCFKCILNIIGQDNFYYQSVSVNMQPDAAIDELNQRFKQHGIGYQFTGGEIIKVDSTYTHSEIVKPTISLLWSSTFAGANEEYLKAHEHYRHGRNKECLTECLKAFESVLKIICKEKSWAYNQTDTAKKLIQICFQNGLVPSFTQNQFTSLQSMMESGVPTIRNKLGGHGQGQVPQKVDDGMTRYALNLTGSNIIFLIEQSGLV